MAGQVVERHRIDPERAPALREAIEQLSAKAVSRGLGEIAFDRVSWKGEVMEVQIASPTPAIGKYELVAKISHLDGGRAFIHPLSGERLDFDAVRKSHATQRCDHCGVKRSRKLTYLLRSAEGEVQVGSTCLKEYVGQSDPRRGLVQADLFAQARELVEAVPPPEPTHKPRVALPSVNEYLTHVAAVIRAEGRFVRKKDVDDHQTATADLAMANYRASQSQSGGEDLLEVSPRDIELARTYKSEFLTWSAERKDLTGFDRRLASCLEKDVAWFDTQGVLATIFWRVQSIRSSSGERGRATPGEWVGKVGEQVHLEVLLRKVGKPVDSKYGPQYPHMFVGPEGQAITWFATNIQLESNRRYDLRGHVKRHDEFNGQRITVLTRCHTELLR